MESGWSGMKWILAEAKRDAESVDRQDTRRPLIDDLTDKSWCN